MALFAQWSTAYAVLTLVVISLNASARAGDRFAYAVFPPWLSPAEAVGRAVAAGARPVRGSVLPFVIMVALTDASTLARLSAHGAWSVTAGGWPLCSAAPVRRP